MAAYPRDEIEEAFHHWWQVGNVNEDWDGWADLFTEDCTYIEHFWGMLRGREEVRAWIEPVMKGVPEVYAVLGPHGTVMVPTMTWFSSYLREPTWPPPFGVEPYDPAATLPEKCNSHRGPSNRIRPPTWAP